MNFKRVFHHWYIYVISAIVVTLLFSWAVSLVTRPSKEERIRICLSSYGANRAALVQALQQKAPSYLREIDVDTIDLDANDYYRFYEVYAPNADIIILPEFKAREGVEKGTLPLNRQYVHALIPEYVSPFFEVNSVPYGLMVYDCKAAIGGAISYVDYVKEGKEAASYFAFFNEKSIHAGELNQQGRDGDFSILKAYLTL